MNYFTRLWLGLALTLAVVNGTQTSFQLTGTTLKLGGIPYFVSPSPVSQLQLGSASKQLQSIAKAFPGGLIPFSVLTTDSASLDQKGVQKALSAWESLDDVWNKSFLTGLFISFNGTSRNPKVSLSHSVKSLGTEIVLTSTQYASGVKASEKLPSGPYFVDAATGNVFQVFRLYNDENQAFVYGTIPDGKGGFTELSAHVGGAATETIAVPSRLYYTPTKKQPLAGKRLAVKDIYDVQGLRTGCGNRAYYELYPAKNKTSPAVQRLLDGGMVLVGKAKTSQFANGESPTGDWVDLHAPYNARGDGYQDASSSSTGSGASMGAYSWLDHTIGSDTGGSMRSPAGVNGVFGNRPSHGAVSLDDVMPLSPELDTGGVFARDAKSWAAVGHWWYQNYTSAKSFPKKILFPTDGFGSSYLTTPPTAGTADAVFNEFITKLEKFLSTNRTEFSLAGTWNSTANATAPLSVVLNTTYADLITIDQIALLADPFIADYKAAHGGRTPFINPAPANRWAYGRTLPSTRKAEAIANKTAFMNWFANDVVKSNADSCSESIFLYPQSSGRANYRNTYRTAPTAPFGFSMGRIAVHGETPDMVVPVGEVAYNSTITGITEYLPVSVSFIAAKGCDLMLFDLFAALEEAGIISPVKTGSRLF